jgi:hypothetical protein
MPPTPAEDHRVICHIDTLLTVRGITQTELAERMGLSLVVARQTLWQGCCVSPEGESTSWGDPRAFLLRRRPGSC